MSATTSALAIQKRIERIIDNKFGNTCTFKVRDEDAGTFQTVTCKAILDEMPSNVERWLPKDVMEQPNRTEILLLFPYTAAPYLMGTTSDIPLTIGGRILTAKRIIPVMIADVLLAIEVVADP